MTTPPRKCAKRRRVAQHLCALLEARLPSSTFALRTFGGLIDLPDEDMHEVGKPLAGQKLPILSPKRRHSP